MIIDALKDAIIANIGPLRDAPKGWKKKIMYAMSHAGTW
jgi:hypothetical protein